MLSDTLTEYLTEALSTLTYSNVLKTDTYPPF